MGWMGWGGVNGGYRRELHGWLFRTVGLFENELGRKTAKKGKWIFLVIASESQNLWMTKSFCSPAWLKSYLYCSDNFHPRTNSFKIRQHMAPSRIQIWTTVSFLHFRLREFNKTWSCVQDNVKSWDRKHCKIESIFQYLYGLVDYTTKGCGIISQKRRGRLTRCLPLDSAASPRPTTACLPVNAQHSCPTCREEDSTRTERASQRRFEAPRTV